MLDGLPRTHDGIAHGSTEVLVVSPRQFETLVTAHPVLLRAFIAQQCRRERMLFTMIDDITTQPLEVRFARHLRKLVAQYGVSTRIDGSDGVLINLHLPQDELAQLLGVSRQRVNQTLKAWERDGTLRQSYGRIVIINAAQLGTMMEAGEARA